MLAALLPLLACTGGDPVVKDPPVEETGTVDTGETGDSGDDGGPHTRPRDTGCEGEDVPWYLDADGDGYGDPDRMILRCEPPQLYVPDAQDCDDTDPLVNPLGAEACNGGDDDCDGETDEAGATGEIVLYPDADGDGWGVDGAETLVACSPRDGFGWIGDCDDTDAQVSPTSPELCDGLDQDCDGLADDDDGTASFDDGSGVLEDVTPVLGDGSKYVARTFGDDETYDFIATSGTLWLCDGTWNLKLLVTDEGTHLAVRGLRGADATWVTTEGTTGGASGSIVSVLDGTLELEGLTIAGGAGSSGTHGGGVIANNVGGGPDTPNITMTDCRVTANETDYGGGVAIYGSAWVSTVDTRIDGNVASIAGGAVWVQGSGHFECEATELGAAGVVGNTAPIGGGVYLSSSSSGSVASTGCDWGDDDAGDDNADYDVEQNPGGEGHAWCWTNATSVSQSLSCDDAECTASSDPTCP